MGLLFERTFHEGLREGRVRVTYRRWKRPQVKVGGRYQVATVGLPEELGCELQPFKTDVRKLERLGLTVSFEVGYALTPRGDEALRALRDAR